MSRRIAVLGGAGGIGRALVAALAEAGDDVVVLDLPASLERHDPGVPSIAIDVRSQESIADAVTALGQRHAALAGFVNLAGYYKRLERLAETSVDYFDEILAGNLRGAFLSTRAMLPLLAEGSSVVLVSSGLAANSRPGYGPYSTAKAGLIALARSLAVEWAPKVRVNTVAPGMVDTAFLRGGTGLSDESGDPLIPLAPYAAAIPLGRVAVPEDIVGPIRFLLGPDSAYMTGQVLWVNGGGYMP